MAWRSTTSDSVSLKTSVSDGGGVMQNNRGLSPRQPQSDAPTVPDGSLRTFSCDDLDYDKAKGLLQQHFEAEAHQLWETLRYVNENGISLPSSWENRDDEEYQLYQTALTRFTGFISEILEAEEPTLANPEQLRRLVCTLQQINVQWQPKWPGKKLVTKILLISCKLSRLNRFLRSVENEQERSKPQAPELAVSDSHTIAALADDSKDSDIIKDQSLKPKGFVKKIKGFLSPRERKKSKSPRHADSLRRREASPETTEQEEPAQQEPPTSPVLQIDIDSKGESSVEKDEPREAKSLSKPTKAELSLPLDLLNKPPSPASDDSNKLSDDYIYCRLCEQPFPVSAFEEHEPKCIQFTMEMQGFQKQADVCRAGFNKALARLTKYQAANANRLFTEALDIIRKLKLLIIEALSNPLCNTESEVKPLRISCLVIKKFITEITAENGFLDTRLRTRILQPLSEVIAEQLDLIKRVLTYSKSLSASRLVVPISNKPSIEDFEILKPISKGAFGSVYLVRKITTDDVYALKVIQKANAVDRNQYENVKRERDILASVHHPCIVRLFYTFQNPKYLFWVMEYLPGGDLLGLLGALGAMNEDMAKRFAAEIVLALGYLHSKGIVHRDLKPDNVLISNTGHLKLTDFGLSSYGLTDLDLYSAFPGESPSNPDIRQFGSLLASPPTFREEYRDFFENMTPEIVTQSKKRLSSKVGTPDYIAPEVILGLGHGKEVDWWALGVMLYEFILGIPPFSASSTDEIFENILNENIVWPEIPEELSSEAYDLISRLLVTDPAERLTLPDIQAHPFFAGIDWADLPNQEAPFTPQVESITDTSYFEESRAADSFHLTPDQDFDISTPRAQYEESFFDPKGIKECPESEAPGGTGKKFLNFTFTNLPNLHALTRETLEKSSPRRP